MEYEAYDAFVCATSFEEEIGQTYVRLNISLNDNCADCGVYKVRVNEIATVSRQKQALYGWKNDTELRDLLKTNCDGPYRVAYSDSRYHLYPEYQDIEGSESGAEKLVQVTLIELVKESVRNLYRSIT